MKINEKINSMSIEELMKFRDEYQMLSARNRKKLLDQFKGCSDLDFFDETVSNKEVKEFILSRLQYRINEYFIRKSIAR